ncbi:MAG: membrane dipeptidase [Pseudomonadota bacterium]
MSSRAAQLLAKTICWDNHACMPHRQEPEWMEQLQAHKDVGVDVVSLNLGDADVSFETQLAMAAHFSEWVKSHSEAYQLAYTVADIHTARASQKLAIIFDVEGGKALDGDLRRIETCKQLGVAWMALVFNRANGIGGGVHDETDHGLTAFGRDVVQALEETGIMVCCSHTGYKTAEDVLGVATKPVIFSHSNAKALHDHPRNIPDDLIKGCAASGGVVGVNGLSIFLGGKDRMPERFVDHIEHIAGVAGTAHVSIGLDYVFDQDDMDAQLAAARGTWPQGYGYEPGIKYLGPDIFPCVADILLSRGWADEAIKGVLGENLMHVAEVAWS